MKTTVNNKSIPKVKKYEAGGAASEMECTEYMDRGKKKKRCKSKFKSKGASQETKGSILGTLGAIAGGIGAYKMFKKKEKTGGATKAYKMGGVKKTTARTRK
jgi:hypothetical protein